MQSHGAVQWGGENFWRLENYENLGTAMKTAVAQKRKRVLYGSNIYTEPTLWAAIA